MSAFKFKKQYLLLPLLAALLAGIIAIFPRSGFSGEDEATVQSAKAENGPQDLGQAEASKQADQSQSAEAHAADCAHCSSSGGRALAADHKTTPTPNVPTSRPKFDPVFKQIGKGETYLSRADFDFLKGSEVGQSASISIGEVEFSGEIALVREGEQSRAYVVELPEGNMTVTVNRVGEFEAILLLNGDSRAVRITPHREEGVSGDLVAKEISLSDVVCAPEGSVYPLNAPQAVDISAGAAAQDLKQFPLLTEPAAALALTSNPGSGHVLYIDFDGEVVTGDFWNSFTGIPSVNAAPAPLANNDAWVTAVWERVVEDFAPFDITVTTDRAVFDAADPEQRLHAIVTPTDDVAPFTGGVAFLNSYASNLTRIVWVFNLSEYTAASTVSHEAGHAFGLSHDGPGPGPSDQYYGGHNGTYTPGWAPIMGAPWNDSFFPPLYDEVDQWSRGEYTNATNNEDDLTIIASGANGFGYVQDDFANTFDGGNATFSVGILGPTGPNQVGTTGFISRAGDTDVFRFTAAYQGNVTFTASPIDVDSSGTEPGSSTQGANLATQLRLLDAAGDEVAAGTNVGNALLASEVNFDIEPGTYYLEVDGIGRGNDATTGFSDYASLGQYSITGDLPTPPLSIFGSAPDRNASGTIIGPGKLDQPVLLGDDTTNVANGTDFGFSFVANSPIIHSFILENTGSDAINNIAVSLDSGVDFEILKSPGSNLPANTATTMTVAYDPIASGEDGIDVDSVIVTYDSVLSETFEFAVSGLSTLSATQDNYEVNNVASQAANLNSVEDIWLSDYKGPAFFLSYHSDFYTFNVNNDELVTVEVSYDDSEGPINFELRNGYNTVLGSTSAVDGQILFRVPDNYNSQHKKFYIKASIDGDSSTRNLYDLRWSSISLSGGDDDLYEENDTQDQAFDLTGAFSPRLSEFLGEGISKDEDWYKIEVPRDPFIRMLYVRAEFEHEQGDINIEVSPSSVYTTGTGDSENDYEVITHYDFVATEDFAEEFDPDGNVVIMGVEPGTYFIRVFGDFAGNEYDLIVETLEDDRYEVVDAQGTENDFRTDATVLGDSVVDQWLSAVDGIATIADYGSGATQENFINQEDTDWFEFSFNPSAPVEQLLIDFDSLAGGTMVFRVFDQNGVEVGNSFEEDGNVTTFFGAGVIAIPNPAQTTYFIEVEATSSVSVLSAYDFRVRLSSEPPFIEGAVDDAYEENDNFTELYDLSDNAGLWLTAKEGYGVQLDPDWYQFSVPEGAEDLFIQTTFTASEGDLDLTLSRKDGPVLFRAEESGGSSKSISWDEPEAGEYALTITGGRRGGQYNLFWDVSMLEDAYEENDVIADAFDLTGHEKQWFSKLDGAGIQADEDWYQINVNAASAELRVLSDFSHADGDIDIEIYDASGFLVARSTSTTDDESISLLNPEIGDYFVRVYYGNEGNEYDLWWGAFTQAELDSITEDAYEEDDSSDAATTLPSFTSLLDLSGLATQTDEDWFEITLSGGSIGFSVEATFTHSEGDIDLEVVDQNGAVITRSTSQTDNEVIDYNAPLPAGNYFIRIYGANLGNDYDLAWIDYREDAFEQNDTFATAYDITDLRQTALSLTDVPSQGDDDWYLMSVEDEDSVMVIELTYLESEGSVFFQLYDSDQNLLTSDLTTDETKYLMYNLPAEGDFYLRVFGDDTFQDYDLFWNALTDDEFEDNDVLADAAVITSDEGEDIEGVVFDSDWFVFDPPYGAVDVELDLNFIHDFGDINMAVYDADGDLIVESTGVSDGENISVDVNPFEGIYYVEISAADQNYGNPYTLVWESVYRDIDEDNDTLATAKDITLLEGIALSDSGGYATSADEDWYIIQPSEMNLTVYCLFDHLEGDIDIELFDQNGDFLVRSISDTDDEAIFFTVAPDDIYYIRVFGETTGNPYDLVWNSYGLDDTFEDNDILSNAADLRAVEYQVQEDLLQADDDWYEIEAEAGDEKLIAELYSDASIEDLVLELYDASESLVDSVTSSEEPARIELAAPVVGVYYLRVSGPNVFDTYGLVWSSGSDDNYEPNDSDLDAYNLSSNSSTPLSMIDGLGVQYDEDWFLVTLTSGGSALSANLDFEHDDGDLSLALLDDIGDEIASSDGATDAENISANDLIAGDYYLRVSGPNAGNTYDLSWSGYVDDNYEDNDRIDAAYDLGSAVTGSLAPIDGFGVRGGDDDYYQLTIPSGYVSLDVTCRFLHADGDISLQLFDGDGNSVATSDTATDDESISVEVDPKGGIIYISVAGAVDTGTTYDLDWTFGLVDAYEDNDNSVDATDISSIEGELLSESMGFATQGDSDFYLVTLPANSRILNVDAFFDHSLGNIDIKVYDSGLTSLGFATSTTDDETLSVSIDPAGGDHYIEVFGANSDNFYDLVWSVELDDNYEMNDSDATAYDLTGDEGVALVDVDGAGNQYNIDYFSVDLPAGAFTLFVDLSYTHANGNIDIEILDPSLVSIASDTGTSDEIGIEVNLDEAGGIYYFVITGDDAGNSYDLTWSALVDDGYEQNDASSSLSDITALNNVRLSADLGLARQLDEDWYSFTTTSGTVGVSITVDDFTNGDGNIDLEVYDSADVLLGSSTDNFSSEEVELILDPAPQTIKIRVFGEDAGNTYDLVWTILPDAYEENNFVEDSYDLTANEGEWLSRLNGFATQADDDWYQIVVSPGATTLTIDCDFTHADGDIDVELYQLDPTRDEEKTTPDLDQRKPTLVDRAISMSDDESIIFDTTGDEGIYFIRVYFGNASNVYDLRWDDGVVDLVGDAQFLNEEWFFSPAVEVVHPFLSEPVANRDGDNFPNWAEYALSMNADIADTVVIDNSIKTIGGKTYFTISFIRSSEAVLRGYQFFVEESRDLNFDGDLAVEDSVDKLDGGLERVTYRSTSDMTDAPQCFFKIRVEAPTKGF